MSGTIGNNIGRHSGTIAVTAAGLSWDTAVDQSRPPGVAAIVPDALATLFPIVPLIIFSF